MTLTEAELDALAEAVERMTSGKWCHVCQPDKEVRSLAVDHGDYAPRLSGSFAHPEDAAGIVALRNSADALLSASRERNALRVRVRELEAGLADMVARASEWLSEWADNDPEADLDGDFAALARLRALLEKKP